jgi:hypothetical protein
MKKMMRKIISSATAIALGTTMMIGSTNVFAAYDNTGSEWGGQDQSSRYYQNSATAAPATSSTSSATSATDVTASDTITSSATEAVSYGSFTDVPTTHWAYEAIERCKASHWFNGYNDGTFHPDGEILRGEAMKVFVQILGLPLSDVTNSTYYDVDVNKWYAPYIEAGKSLFAERRSTDGQLKFQPEMPITREETAYALVMALGYGSEVKNVDESVLNMYSDQTSISTNLRPYLAWASTAGLITGYSNGTIGAQEPLTRAQFATMLGRANTLFGFNNNGTVQKVVSSIVIDPSTYKEITVGESFEITAVVNYSDGTSEDYTNNLNPYTDSVEGIVTINKNKVNGVGEGTVLINYNDEKAADQTLVVNVKPDPNKASEPEATAEPEPTAEPVDPVRSGVLTGSVDKEDMPTSVAKRYTVLSIDVSGSMYSGDKIGAAKNAATAFCDTVLGNSGDDYIALVAYDTNSTVVCDFTNDLNTLKSGINGLYAGGGTNIYGGMTDAETLLDNIQDSNVLAKSIILLTDGYPCVGPTSASGKYSISQWSYSDYANPVYEKSQEAIAKGYDIYTIGFYTSGIDDNVQEFLKDIQNKGYYLASQVDKLAKIFDKIAKIIVVSGVDVELKDGDIVLDSCQTTQGACDFRFTVNAGTYTLVVSAPGYKTVEKTVEITAEETNVLDPICLELE